MSDIDDDSFRLPSSHEKVFNALVLLHSDAVVEHHQIYVGSDQIIHRHI